MYNFTRPNIGKLVEKKDLKGLVAALFYTNFRNDNIIKNEAALALRRMDVDDPKLMKQLVLALASEVSNVRCSAAWGMVSLIKHGHKPPLEPIICALEDDDGFVRAAVIRVAEGMLNPGAIDLLLMMFAGKIRKPINNGIECSTFLVEALCSYARAFPDEIARLMVAGVDDGRYPICFNVVQILAKTHHPSTLGVLAAALNMDCDDRATSRMPGEFRTSKLSEAAAEAIGKLKKRESVPPLINVLSIPSQAPATRVKIIEALGEIGDPSASEVLSTFLHDGTQPVEVRTAAQSALAKLSF